MYGLRHTFATNFIKDHPDKLEYLRELLGHKDLKMIRKHYGHLFDEHKAMHEWCARVSEQTGQIWKHARIKPDRLQHEAAKDAGRGSDVNDLSFCLSVHPL